MLDFGLPHDHLNIPLTFPGTELRTIPEVREYFAQQYEALAGSCHRLLRKIPHRFNLMELDVRGDVEAIIKEYDNPLLERDTRECIMELMKSEQCNAVAASVIYHLQQQELRVPPPLVLTFDFRN